MKIHYTHWLSNGLFAILLTFFCFQNLSIGQTDCPPFHITLSEDACVDPDAFGIQPGLDIHDFRTINGTFNNLEDVEVGRAGGRFLRQNNLAFYDGDGQSLRERGNPRHISNLIFDQTESIPDPNGLSAMVFTYLQFIDHDITAVEGSGFDLANIPVPAGDPHFDPFNTGNQVIPFHRSVFEDGTGTDVDNPRQHHNEITPWVDASMVYGSDLGRAAWLRSGECGRLKTSSSPHGDLLPYNTLTGEFDGEIDMEAPFMAGDRAFNGDRKRVFVAGDVRANEQTGLTSMHTLFVREHNRICDGLAGIGMCDDDANYHYARKLVSGQIQSILYNEVLPALGIELPNYSYAPDKSPQIFHSFASAAFRLGHTMVTDEVLLVDENCGAPENAPSSLFLSQAFFNPTLIKDHGPTVFLRGLMTQTQEKLDAKVINSLRNFLFGAPGSGGLDLASLNIQRGRDHGIPDFNQARELFALDRISDFSEITTDLEIQENLASLYDTVDNIDLWVGVLVEDPLSGKSIGETLNRILELQFRNMRDADRFYYLNDPILNNQDKWLIHNTTLAEVLKRNTNIQFAHNAFFAKECYSDEDYCEATGSDTSFEWIESVKIGNTKITTGNNNGYLNLTNFFFTIETETPNFLELRAGYADTEFRENWAVWIDLNRDEIFDETEKIFEGFDRNTVVGAILIEGVTPGYTRMRVAMNNAEAPSECGNFGFGEVEDYMIFIKKEESDFRLSGDNFNQDFSPIAKIENYKVFPNPAAENTTIAFNAKQSSEAKILIANSLGKIVELIEIKARQGENMQELSLKSYKNGVYWVQLQLDGQRAKTVKMVVAN